ncbi:PREDICTED: activating signal cointegrator 1 complex subunit 3 isoform X2 [Erythranthe guttata]|uniref:activating signal cointegrator 1 complex subunit 3 isoform X2 n=1 Tax=Erythranthe guttata TaxID=4155 RepID=UPI00064DAA49|nr:PREDICTED: activating signal cointegrator 1 complex subunit 3 isoform X2 [Erythranthe guttata]|eukprot:XP_012853916.1 PREDICTED: activating signal cointegrator 1 complex subunit 3 isoform X2 [Erythranthe guttata]
MAKMLLELPRLTNSLRLPFDADQAYLNRKSFLQTLNSRRSAVSLEESELARKIFYRWEEASVEVRQLYKQFITVMVELMGDEVVSEEFQEVGLNVYRLFSRDSGSEEDGGDKRILAKKSEFQKLIGHIVPEQNILKVASLVERLSGLQSNEQGNGYLPELGGADSEGLEFGADLVFQPPARFLVDISLEDAENLLEETSTSSSNHEGWSDKDGSAYFRPPNSEVKFDLEWLQNACDRIVRASTSQLPRDELAMTICRILDSEKPGDEIAGDLLDIVGDSSFETVQDLIMHRKDLVESFRHGLLVLKSDKSNSNTQLRLPSYATQVTVQTESERQIDKLRRKEEKKNRRGTDHGIDNNLSFSSLLQASEKKNLLDDLVGHGDSTQLAATALPQGTVRKHFKGYEEVTIPPTPTAPMKPGEKLIDIKELDDIAQAAFHGYKSLNRIQSRIFQTTYYTNENILVCAPTGAGKTNIAMISILHEVRQHFRDGYLHKDEFKIVYVAPMKALAAEVTSTFSHRLSPLNVTVRELTGDMQLSKNELEETQMIVTTPEKWDVITRKSSDMALSMLVKLLIIDEVHLLNDDRGPVIEALVARTLRQVESTQSMIRIVGLSATLPNYLEVAQFLRVNPDAGLFFFDSGYRPVPLEQQYIGISERNYSARNELMNEICYNKVVDSLRRGHQVMVFVHSRKDTAKTADKLVEMAKMREDFDLFTNASHPQQGLMKKEVLKSRNKDVVQLFEYAVGIHHAGMLRADRGLTERLFSEGLLRVLVCTATLAWGVNLPAHTVVIKGTQIYDPKAGGWRDIGMLDVMQIFGRAGRPQFDKSGEGIIITGHDKLAYYLRLLTSQLPIESQFITSLKDNLNAEVALGTVTNVKEACAWLGYTYLFIRMKMNPLAYGIGWDEVIADPSLSLKQRALVSDAARSLDKAKMMRFDEKSGNFYCTELGRIASHFYIQYSSVETYNELMRRHMSDSEVIDMVAHSSEFENIVVREEEQNELETLARTCPLEIKGGPSSKHGKVSILIQLYISRGSIDSFSLVSDASYISASLARIMRALFEICLRRGWSEMTSFMLDYCKAVDRQIWPHQHPLRQFNRDISSDILRKLEERGVDLDRLYEMEEKDIGALIRYVPGGKLVKQYLGYFPMVQLFATVSPITRTVLKVDLTITPEFVWKDRFHGTAQRWWILVEDSENDHIYHSDLFTLTKKTAKAEPQKLSFTIPIFEPHPPQYIIRAISDSWLHAESFYTISFQNLALPEAHTTHTELLDLKPLPVTALGNETYEALYKFTHFNPIQTQAFHVLYHTNQNVLLGAPTGSGKTISAELALLHMFNTQPDMKAIYIAPLKALVRERMNDWRKRLVSQLGKRMVEMTGDYTPDMNALLAADIIISTPEKWDGISRNWHTRGYVKKVGLMILDEIHLLGADRGPILEVIVSRMRYISSQTERSIRFVGLSTALANAHDLGDWLGVEENGLFNFKPSVRPVPLEVHIQGYPGKYYCPRMNSMNKPTYASICTHSPTKPVLIFVSSRRQTRLTALDLIQYAASDEHPRQFLAIPEESLQMILSQVTDQNLRHTLQFGIGLHHAGLNDKDRSLVEELFANNKIQVLVCTSTLAWGVNLPAHLVIIKGTEFFDAKSKRYVDFPITDILQMMGRAGRPQFDQHGKAIILVHEPKKSFYKKFLYEPFPVESSLREQLHDHINAEIVSGTICHKEDAVHYLTWTYLFRRLMVNPAYYGLEDTDPGTLSSYMSSLAVSTFEDLEDSGCIKIDEDRVEPMMLGSVASQYYLKYTTVSMFASNVEADTTLEVFLHVLAGASEYDELPVRHNEEIHNAELSNKVRYMVDKNLLDDPHVKANLLFQAHFSRVELPVTDYVTDLKSVLDQSIRIIQAMIDLCANSGWLSSMITCMHLLQMVMQGLWFDKDSSLWMLPCMTDDLITTLGQRGISSVRQLLDLPTASLQALIKSSGASRLHEELQHFPRIQARLRVQKQTVQDNPRFSLNIRLEKTNRHRKTSRAFTPRFPKVKDEAWWLVLGNTSTSQLHALKRVSFADVLQTKMDIPSNVNDFQDMKLIIVSDCYVGFEQEHSIQRLL